MSMLDKMGSPEKNFYMQNADVLETLVEVVDKPEKPCDIFMACNYLREDCDRVIAGLTPNYYFVNAQTVAEYQKHTGHELAEEEMDFRKRYTEAWRKEKVVK